jgi:ABC-2 type transport system ATP-binding protein
MAELVIETNDLRKSYKEKEAVCGLNLQVKRGSIYGFLGRNGSGKTTTIKLLLGLAFATSGDARVFGLRPHDRDDGVKIRQRIGYDSEVKVEQMTDFTRSFFPNWDHKLEASLLKKFELPLRQNIRTLSKGMRAKLALLLALPRRADLLILDEPTDGLDPEINEEVLQTIVSLAASSGTTVFFSSHRLNEVEQIADHICIIDRGRSVVSGELDDLKTSYRRVNAVFDGAVPQPMLTLAGQFPTKHAGRVLSVLTNGEADNLVAQAQACNAVSIDVLPVTLKEIFLECRESEQN